MTLVSAIGNNLVFENGTIIGRHSGEADNWIMEFFANEHLLLDKLYREWLAYNKGVLGWEHTILIGRKQHFKDKTILPYILITCNLVDCPHCQTNALNNSQ
jgi:hypothetical protein